MTGWRFEAFRRAGPLVLLSGQLDGRATSDPEAQFVAVFDRIGEVLEQASCGWGDVVEMTSFHVGFPDHLEVFADVRARYVVEPWPAWTAVGVTALAVAGALVEVKVTAAALGSTAG